ncbi:hypothetical protein V8C86DRAFT_2643587 [Haematococcus lacustris]
MPSAAQTSPNLSSSSNATNSRCVHSDDCVATSHKRKRVQSLQELSRLDRAASPVLAPLGLQESMTAYFARFKASPSIEQAHATCSPGFDQGPGVYMFKRPVLGPDGALSPLAACGSVFHHVVLYVMDEQGKISSLDFAPANGTDTTAALLESLPARPCLNAGPLPSTPEQLQQPQQALSLGSHQPPAVMAAATVAATPAAGHETSPGVVLPGQPGALPLLYLGPLAMPLDGPDVQQVLRCAEARPYNALTNNCIQFADALARILTGGAVCSAPLLYDLLAGTLPAVDHPMVMMMQMMTQTSWHSVCDGSRLYNSLLAEATSAGTPVPKHPHLPPPSANDAPTQHAAVLASPVAAALTAATDAAGPGVSAGTVDLPAERLAGAERGAGPREGAPAMDTAAAAAALFGALARAMAAASPVAPGSDGAAAAGAPSQGVADCAEASYGVRDEAGPAASHLAALDASVSCSAKAAGDQAGLGMVATSLEGEATVAIEAKSAAARA